MLHGGAFEFHYHLNQKGCHPKAGKASGLVPEYLVESSETKFIRATYIKICLRIKFLSQLAASRPCFVQTNVLVVRFKNYSVHVYLACANLLENIKIISLYL